MVHVTDVRIKLTDGEGRVKAFATMTLNEAFVVRDVKVIEQPDRLLIAMPSRKLTDRCHQCSHKNHLQAKYCNQCGMELYEARVPTDEDGRPRYYADVAHPIKQTVRCVVETAVLAAYEAAVAQKEAA